MLRCYVSQTLQRVRKRNCGAFQPMRSIAGAFAMGASQLPPAPLKHLFSRNRWVAYELERLRNAIASERKRTGKSPRRFRRCSVPPAKR